MYLFSLYLYYFYLYHFIYSFLILNIFYIYSFLGWCFESCVVSTQQKKLVNRGCERFYCLPCLAAQFGVSEELLREKARQFQSSGCALFEGMEIGDKDT